MSVVVVAAEQGSERESAYADALFPRLSPHHDVKRKTEFLSAFSTLQRSSQFMSGSMISPRKTTKPMPRSHVDSHTPADLY